MLRCFAVEKSNCQLLVALPGITVEAGLHLLMGLLSGIFSTLTIFLSPHQFISLPLHLLAFRQSAFIPFLTFPYWPQQFLSILAWLLLLLFILSAGSLPLFDLSIVMAFCSLHFVSQPGTVTPASQTWVSPTCCSHSHFLTGSERGARLCKAMVFHWLFYVFSKKTHTGNRIFAVVWKL